MAGQETKNFALLRKNSWTRGRVALRRLFATEARLRKSALLLSPLFSLWTHESRDPAGCSQRCWTNHNARAEKNKTRFVFCTVSPVCICSPFSFFPSCFFLGLFPRAVVKMPEKKGTNTPTQWRQKVDRKRRGQFTPKSTSGSKQWIPGA